MSPIDNVPVDSKTAVSFPASPSSHATVTNAGPSTAYYKAASDVDSGDTALAKGESVTYTEGVRWFISAGTSRLFVTFSPEATTDMATQKELEAYEVKESQLPSSVITGSPPSAKDNFAVGTTLPAIKAEAEKNTAIGPRALEGITEGSKNVAIGPDALKANTTGKENVAIGPGALQKNTSGETSVAVGNGSLATDTSTKANTAVGWGTLNKNNGGEYNTAVGLQALYENTEGQNNTAVGAGALLANTTGEDNVAIGVEALYENTEGNYNTALGEGAALKVKTGNSNIAIGFSSLHKNVEGDSNIAIGAETLEANTTDHNVAVGFQSLNDVKAGPHNTAIGSQAGKECPEWAEGNVFIGFQAGLGAEVNNSLYIANSSTATPLIRGDFANKTLKVNGKFIIGELETEDPEVAGELWNSEGTVKVSAG